MSGGRRRHGKADEILQGILLVDKPAGITSHEVCQRVKHRMRLGKVGHGGTLDPFATGLLPLLLNGATRLMPSLQAQDKVYEATVRLGVRTDTMDPTGQVLAQSDASGVDEARIREVLPRFVGPQKQTVPRYAAARVDGRRLYEYAREGVDVELPEKEIVIHGIEGLGSGPGEGAGPGTLDLRIRVHCGPGTYVRALADDIGQALGCGGHLFALRRVRNGTLSVDRAIALDRIVERSEAWRAERQAKQDASGEPVPFVPEENARAWREFVGDALTPVADLLGGMPRLRLPDRMAERVSSGQPLRKSDLETLLSGPPPPFRPGDRLLAEDSSGARAIAILRATAARESLTRREAGAVVFQVERVLR
jgi:tRNA pseudouridine55 synthase